MATISGRLIFNSARTTSSAGTLPGIANVPIVLQNTSSGAMLAVLTNANGYYSFTNVPNADYQIVEYYGMTPVTATPGDFSGAVVGSILAGGITPPISYVPSASVPAGATNLDCLTPNTLLVSVTGSNETGKNILNGPVRYTPISTIMDSNAVVLSNNIITYAENGTFGSWPPGKPANNALPDQTYSGVGPGFQYVQSSIPVDGQFTIMNINTNGALGVHIWWRFADHTTGNEIGRMMVVNGDNPGATIFEEIVTVKPNTYYLFSTWILNLIKINGAEDPALGVLIFDSKGQILAQQTLGQLIPANTNTPEWVQAGTVIYSGDNSTLAVLFISQGGAKTGNDYAIDDIALYEVEIPELNPVKTTSTNNAAVGETVTFTVKLQNIYDRAINNLTFLDIVPNGLTFVAGTVKVNGIPWLAENPNSGFALPDLPGGKTVIITFDAKVDSIPVGNPALNTAKMSYDYTIVEGGVPSQHDRESNEVPVYISESADISVIKKPDTKSVKPGHVLTYAITVTNNGPSPANNTVLTDTVPSDLLNVEYSADNGATWHPWSGNVNFGIIPDGSSRTLLIKGTVKPTAVEPLVNTAKVLSATYDPDMKNNSSTTVTNIFGPRCQAIADVIESVAMQEAALSNILDAEGKKIQTMLDIHGVTPEQLLTLNNSASRLIGAITRLEMILHAKLNLFTDSSC